MVKQLSKCTNSNQHVSLRTRIVKSDIIKKVQDNKIIQSRITLVNESESKSVVQMYMCAIEVEKNKNLDEQILVRTQ